MNSDAVFLRRYGERGIVNALVSHVAASPRQRIQALLRAIRWGNNLPPQWIDTVLSSTVFVEWGLADFGNPDLVVVISAADGPRCVFLEAKVGPYLSSMMPNGKGMREAGYNSSINGQLALKFRFANALEASKHAGSIVEEPRALLQQYRERLGDPRREPRRLAKPDIVEMLRNATLLGLDEERCHYVALTWDVAERAFFNDPFVAAEGGLPSFIRADGQDAWDVVRSRVGWLGFAELHEALGLGESREFFAAFTTMQQKLQPDSTDYRVAEGAFRSEISAESIAAAASFRELFKAYDVVQSKGSYSVRENGQTIAKIIPRRNMVFVGIRDSKDPEQWFKGSLERVTVQGVPFFGLWVRVEHPDDSQLSLLVQGLPPTHVAE